MTLKLKERLEPVATERENHKKHATHGTGLSTLITQHRAHDRVQCHPPQHDWEPEDVVGPHPGEGHGGLLPPHRPHLLRLPLSARELVHLEHRGEGHLHHNHGHQDLEHVDLKLHRVPQELEDDGAHLL